MGWKGSSASSGRLTSDQRSSLAMTQQTQSLGRQNTRGLTDIAFEDWKRRQEYLKGDGSYMSMWAKSLENAGGTYNDALNTLNYAIGETGNMRGAADRVAAIGAQMGNDFQDFNAKYSPMEDAAIGEFGESMADRKSLRSSFMELAPDDPNATAEAAGQRAITDVGIQGEMGRRAGAREMTSLGIDPSSGAYQGMQNRARTDEGLNKVFAGNAGRTMEKNRLTDIVSRGLQLIDPYQSSNAAMNIRGQRMGMRQQQAGTEAAAGSLYGNVSKTLAGIGSAQAGIGGRQAQLGSEFGKLQNMGMNG